VLARKLAGYEEAVSTLTARRNVLQGNVDAAIANSAAPYDPAALLELIKQPEGADMRLRLRAEMRKRVSKVMLSITPELVGYSILYVNGTMRTGATDRAGLRHDAATFQEVDGVMQIVDRSYAAA